MMTNKVFDDLVQSLQEAGANGGMFSLHCKDTPTETYMMLDSLDRTYGGGNIVVYRIGDKEGFLNRLYAVLDARDGGLRSSLDVHAEETHDVVWDVLSRCYTVVEFDEFL
jgi:hypothetical protein